MVRFISNSAFGDRREASTLYKLVNFEKVISFHGINSTFWHRSAKGGYICFLSRFQTTSRFAAELSLRAIIVGLWLKSHESCRVSINEDDKNGGAAINL